MSGGFGATPWGQYGLGGEPTPFSNPLLSRPSVVWCLELDLLATFPITFPFTFGMPPLRVCSGDEYPPGVLGGKLYEKRLLEMQAVTLQAPDPFGGPQQVGAVTFRVAATSDDSPYYPDLHSHVGWEHRGKLVRAHLYDRLTGEISENVFRGQIIAMADDLHTVSIACRALDALTLTDPIPQTVINTDNFPFAPAKSLQQLVPLGAGIGRNLPAYPIKVRQTESTLVAKDFTADATTDRLLIPAHEFLGGEGPMRLTTTGQLPTGLETTRDYFIVPATDDEVQLTTFGNAGAIIDILDAGTGTHTLAGGVAPNLDPASDYVVTVGNAGIVRVWASGLSSGEEISAASKLPDTYTVLPRTYQIDGAWCTALRFPEGDDNIKTVDVIDTYPPMDGRVLAEWKWLRGFQDEVGGFDAVLDGFTTANLVPNHVGIGLGAVRFDGSAQRLLIPNAAAFAIEEFTLEIEWTPRFAAGATAEVILATGPLSDLTHGWRVSYDQLQERIVVLMSYRDATLSLTSVAFSVPNHRLSRIVLRREGIKAALYVGRQKLAETNFDSPMRYLDPTAPFLTRMQFGDLTAPPVGDLGYVRFSVGGRSDREITQAYWLMRRNPSEALRRMVGNCKRPVDGTAAAQLALDLDAVEDGALKWDGYVTEETTLGAVLNAAAPIRDLHYDLAADGSLAITAAVPPTTIVGQFGTGDEFANLVEAPTRNRASLTEAVRDLTVRFRRNRDQETGALIGIGYARQLAPRNVFSVGHPVILELPFTDDPVSADIQADFRVKRLVTTDQVFGIATGHEGRRWALEDVIRFRTPAMGIPALDVRLIQLAKGPGRQSARAVPVSLADHAYTPRPLPAEPMLPILRGLDLGPTPTINVTATPTGRSISASLSPGVTDLQRPTGDVVISGFTGDWPTLVGAATAWQAVSEAVADENASYMAGTLFKVHAFTFAPLPRVLPRVGSLTITARLRMTGTGQSAGVQLVLASTDPTVAAYHHMPPWTVTTTSYADRFIGLGRSPFTGAAWTVEELNNLVVALYLLPNAPPFTCEVRCTQLFRQVIQVQDAPRHLGYIRWWIRPGLTAPPTPAETDDSTPTDVAPIEATFDWEMPPRTVPTDGLWWVWARVYDVLNRLVATVGPFSVPVVGP